MSGWMYFLQELLLKYIIHFAFVNLWNKLAAKNSDAFNISKDIKNDFNLKIFEQYHVIENIKQSGNMLW